VADRYVLVPRPWVNLARVHGILTSPISQKRCDLGQCYYSILIGSHIPNISKCTMLGDLQWPLNASRGFVSISWASCSYSTSSELVRLYSCNRSNQPTQPGASIPPNTLEQVPASPPPSLPYPPLLSPPLRSRPPLRLRSLGKRFLLFPWCICSIVYME